MEIFGIGGAELVAILIIMLVVAGPKRMVQWAYVLGQYVSKARAMWDGVMAGVQKEIDDAGLDIDETCVMVLKYAGPVGYPGMPEVGNMALPKKILEKGIKDMVRISDGRMSGTAYGTVVLHVSPESAVGGNLALVQNGDMIELDAEKRILHLHVSDEVLETRRAAWTPPPPAATRGYVSMYVKHVMGADKGADLDFLAGSSGSVVTRDSH